MPSTHLLGEQVKGGLFKERIETPKRYAVSTFLFSFPALLGAGAKEENERSSQE